jgi:hypothetical protein
LASAQIVLGLAAEERMATTLAQQLNIRGSAAAIRFYELVGCKRRETSS